MQSSRGNPQGWSNTEDLAQNRNYKERDFVRSLQWSEFCTGVKIANGPTSRAEMETGRVDRHRLGRPTGRVTGRVDILRPAGQAG